MKIVLPGGSGQVGTLLARHFHGRGDEVVVLSRGSQSSHPWKTVSWDAQNLGAWVDELEGAGVVINLAGRTVNCRYSKENRRQILDSRVQSVKVLGDAIAGCSKPPTVWLQSSTATIYAHRFDAANGESDGIVGGNEEGAPDTWRFSIQVAEAWERALDEAPTPNTRKVKLRSSMVMSADPGGIFATLLQLVRLGLGGRCGSGKQYVSWIHGTDFVRALDHLIKADHLEGAVNIAAPTPLPQVDFMRDLRHAWGKRIGLPATRWMLEIGAIFMRTETELILKSRRVVPERLEADGFSFRYPKWPSAAQELCKSWKKL
ncbi:MAG: TIGR01777 family oxidoreductase [Planctomycetota bacterium]